jgi:hypothetical protein
MALVKHVGPYLLIMLLIAAPFVYAAEILFVMAVTLVVARLASSQLRRGRYMGSVGSLGVPVGA